MRFLTSSLAGVALAACLLPAAASAQSEAELTQMFGQLDGNGNGQLEPAEVGLMMGGAPADSGPVKMMIIVLDTDGSGTLSPQEFAAISAMSGGTLTEDQFQRLFAHFDSNGDGYVDRDELTTAMQSMNEYQGPQSVDDALAESDTNGDGRVDYEEFKAVVN